MKILAIETSCDETAVSVVRAEPPAGEADGDFSNVEFTVLGNTLVSQIDIHREYGGVFPAVAKREHAKSLVPLTIKTLKEAGLHTERETDMHKDLEDVLLREPDLLEQFKKHISKLEKPNIDMIAVTHGPGLEPALWVGINFARALSLTWNVPVIPVNHMEGHIFSALLGEKIENTYRLSTTEFPALALLISGGHTELVLIKSHLEYEIIGETQDDAAGEAFDKVARMLSLPYPGGPELSRLSEIAREKSIESPFKLPRPMKNSDNFDFSFSGLKTAVLYKLKKIGENSKNQKSYDTSYDDVSYENKLLVAREFEDAVADVLVHKTRKAIEKYNAKTLLVGGGVSANKYIREKLGELDVKLLLPQQELTGDNAIMIAIAGYFRKLKNGEASEIRAEGNLRL
jgi:N6-L-threonylcarbamoyladenine synthase|tara:strand:+ start:1688 stop:2890 length:1203 start_codon:yes stop_codon:yes gene_type:complete